MNEHRDRRLPVVLLLLALAVSGCVRKGDPLAPIRPDPPVLAAADPASVRFGTTGVVTIRVTGSAFRSSTVWGVSADGVTLAGHTFLSDTAVELRLAISAAAAPGPVTITAANPGSETVAAALFEIVEPAGPRLLTASPSTLLPGTSVRVSFTGENLEPGCAISSPAGSGISWSAASCDTPASASAVATAEAGAGPGPRDVTVTNPGGRRGTTVGLVSVGTAADPAVFSTSPNAGPQGASGLSVQIRGANFKAGATAAFSGGGIAVRSVGFVNPARLDVVVDIAATAPIGAYDLTVTNPDGKSGRGARVFSVTAPAVRLSTQVQPILTANCGFAGCHGGGSPAQGMNLGAGSTYASTVGVVSAEAPPLLRIKPGDPGNSWLVRKIEGTQTVGQRMPLGSPPLSAAEISTIRTWIQQGAPNN